MAASLLMAAAKRVQVVHLIRDILYTEEDNNGVQLTIELFCRIDSLIYNCMQHII